MDSKHIVLSKSNHQDGNDDIVEKNSIQHCLEKRDTEIVGHTYTHMHTHNGKLLLVGQNQLQYILRRTLEGKSSENGNLEAVCGREWNNSTFMVCNGSQSL